MMSPETEAGSEIDALDLSALNLVPTALLVFDSCRRIRWVNPAAEALFGCPPRALLGSGMFHVPASRRKEADALWERVIGGEVIRDFETVRMRGDHSEVFVSLNAQRFQRGDGPWVIVGAVDISEQRLLRRTLSEGRGRYKRLAASLESARQQREKLVRMLVHDFKSPISVIAAGLSFIERSGVLHRDAEARSAADDAIACTEILSNMTLNLLDIARSEDGTLRARKQPVDVRAFLRDMVSLRSRVTRRSISFLDGASGDGVAWIDSELFRRVVRNLLDNAAKYGGDGPIEVRLREGGQRMFIEVADQGPGIQDSLKPGVFDKYAHLDDGTATAAMSHGLGLAFCKLAVEAHGGTIDVRDNDPRGTCFTIALPALAHASPPV